MNLDVFLMNGYGIYVWSSFLLTFLVCLFLFLKTKKNFKKLEKDFIKKHKVFQKNNLKILKNKNQKEILVSHSKTNLAFLKCLILRQKIDYQSLFLSVLSIIIMVFIFKTLEDNVLYFYSPSEIKKK